MTTDVATNHFLAGGGHRRAGLGPRDPNMDGSTSHASELGSADACWLVSATVSIYFYLKMAENDRVFF